MLQLSFKTILKRQKRLAYNNILMYKIRFKHVRIVRHVTLNELKNEDFKNSKRVNGSIGHMKIALKKIKVLKFRNYWVYNIL